MMLTRSLFFVLLASILTVSCGKDNRSTQQQPPPVTPPNPPVTPKKAVVLMLFGAPWCSNCKRDFPELQSILDRVDEATRKSVVIQLYVTTGEQASQKPTQEIADAYLKATKLKGTAQPDPWRWTTFRKYVPGKMELPAGVLMNGKGEVQKVYTAGSTSFVPAEIAASAIAATN